MKIVNAIFCAIACITAGILLWHRNALNNFLDRYLFDRLSDLAGFVISGVVLAALLAYQAHEYFTEKPRRNLYTYQLPYTAFTIVFLVLLVIFDWIGLIQPDVN